MNYENSIAFAQEMDSNDPLSHFRERFHFPQYNGTDSIYFCGNSLGLQPKSAAGYVTQEMEDWARFGVHGHFEAKNPWYSYHEMFADPLSRLVGALPSEVVAMNGLTVNLHLLLISFYRPEGKKFKILCEHQAFPSDQYAMESQARLHGFDPEEAIVEVKPKEGSQVIESADILAAIEELKDELALVLFSGVNYYTGQCFDMKSIAHAAQAANITVGFDLAHAAGNIKTNLHDWGVDFAAWCSYKYLNSGSGSVAGAFVHEKHHNNNDLIRLAGWWGHDKETRFQMKKGFKPIPTVEAWQLTNAPILSMAAHKASLDIFDEAGIDALCNKRDLLTGYLEYLIHSLELNFNIITPENKDERGCQLSILTDDKGKPLHETLNKNGVVSDWRNPNVIRVAPVPLYNSFEDVYRFGEILSNASA